MSCNCRIQITDNETREALACLRRCINTNETATAADLVAINAALTALFAAGLVVADLGTGSPVAGSGTSGRLLNGIEGITVFDNGPGLTVDVKLNINGLTTDALPDSAADFISFYDTSEGVHNKALISSLLAVAHTHTASQITDFVAAAILAVTEAIALADLSDVTAKTGTGTVVAMQTDPVIARLLLPTTFSIRRTAGGTNLFVVDVQETANYWHIETGPSGATSAIIARALGTATNLSFNFIPQGSGTIQINGVALSALFQALDATLTSIAAVSGVQGDLLYADGTDTWTRLAKSATTTHYLSNTGTSNNPAWSQVNLANGVSGDLPFANLTQGSALSVLGVTGNATADNASIAAASDHQVMRRSGTAVAFGAVNLAQSAAVTGTLPVANLPTGTKTHSRTFYMGSPAVADAFPITGPIPFNATVTRIMGWTDTGTVDFNVEKRAKTTPLTAGTDINSGDMVAAATPVEDTSFASPAVTADQRLWVTISAVASSPTKFGVDIDFTAD